MSFGLNRYTYFIWALYNAALIPEDWFCITNNLWFCPTALAVLFRSKSEGVPRHFSSTTVYIIVIFCIETILWLILNKLSFRCNICCLHRNLWVMRIMRKWPHWIYFIRPWKNISDALMKIAVFRDFAQAECFSFVLIRQPQSCWLRGWFCYEIMSLIKRPSTHEKACVMKPCSVGGPPQLSKSNPPPFSLFTSFSRLEERNKKRTELP